MRLPTWLNRVGDIAVGLACIAAGLAILAGLIWLAMLAQAHPKPISQTICLVVGAWLYTLVGELFIVFGLRRVAGDESLFEKWAGQISVQFAVLLGVAALLIVVCVAIIVW